MRLPPRGPLGHPMGPPRGPLGHPVGPPRWALWAPRGPPVSQIALASAGGLPPPRPPATPGGLKPPRNPLFKSAFGLRSSLAIASSLARYRELQKAGGVAAPPAPPPQIMRGLRPLKLPQGLRTVRTDRPYGRSVPYGTFTSRRWVPKLKRTSPYGVGPFVPR